ncbi:MAG: hypothetical protein U0R44_05245 [Candidatus Micrarchaeia archaeon]
MCLSGELLGEGDALLLQGLTLASIGASVLLWIRIYAGAGIGLRQYAVPIALWIAFGSLDAVMTANGTFSDPLREANPLTRFALVEWGFWGMPAASFLWVSLWAGLVLMINRATKDGPSRLISLVVFYSLAVGHLFGFSSWYLPLCPIAKLFPPFVTTLPKIIIGGALCAAAHHFAWKTRGDSVTFSYKSRGR